MKYSHVAIRYQLNKTQAKSNTNTHSIQFTILLSNHYQWLYLSMSDNVWLSFRLPLIWLHSIQSYAYMRFAMSSVPGLLVITNIIIIIVFILLLLMVFLMPTQRRYDIGLLFSFVIYWLFSTKNPNCCHLKFYLNGPIGFRNVSPLSQNSISLSLSLSP